MRAYPKLENFFAAYFHQDWAMEHDTPEAVVAYYRGSEAPEQVSRARAEVEALLGEGLDDGALGNRIAALGSEYDPTRDDATWRSWLQRFAQELGGTYSDADCARYPKKKAGHIARFFRSYMKLLTYIACARAPA